MTAADLAAEAAHHWSGSIVRLIKNRENVVFEMRLPHGRAALRLHREGYQNTAAIESELWWCTALASSGVAVPAALPTHNGAVLARLSTGRAASAIAWVQGEALGHSGDASDENLISRLCSDAKHLLVVVDLRLWPHRLVRIVRQLDRRPPVG